MKKIFALLIAAVMFCTPVSAKYESYTAAAREDGVVFGDETGSFNEDKIITRAEFAVMLANFFDLSGGINTFSDVKESDWFSNALSAVHRAGLLLGTENGEALPYAPVTREVCVTVLGRRYNAMSESSEYAVSDFAKPYWAYAESEGLLFSDDPKEYVTKGEALGLIYEFDAAFGGEVRFLTGYPRVSEKAEFSKISIDIKTNVPSTIYYRLGENGSETVLCRTEAKKVHTVAVAGNMNKEYNLHLRAVADNGTEKSAVLNSVRPFSMAIGSGTAEDPYMVYTALQLAQVSGAHYRLGDDIVISGEHRGISGFSGTLDGDGHKVTIESETDGLFADLCPGAVVENLTVYADVKTGKCGGIIAGVNDGGSILGCAAVGSLEVKTDDAGGICGKNMGTVKNCLSAAYSVASGSFAGGICGRNFGTVENCLSAAEVVAAQMYAGGICGTNEGGVIKNSVGANMTVYDSLTQNSGKLTTNRKNGIAENNYCYDGIISNAAYEEPGKYSQNGYNVSWQEICSEDFYETLGWDKALWSRKNGGYKLISPKKTAEIELVPGKTMYYPKVITTGDELRGIDKNSAGHYALGCDISLSMPWKTICGNGFSGTLDGNGFSVYNLDLKGESGMFSNITGGTIKNLTLKNVKAAPTSAGAILAACNYGYIENCKIYGRLDARKTGYVGTFAGENHGAIIGCDVFADIAVSNSNSTCGGICAENDGNIINCLYRGKITAKSENAVIGGICGMENGGNVSECISEAEIDMNVNSGYAGGICGIMSGTSGYKCASTGSITAEADETLYAGGISGMGSGTVIYNAFSTAEVRANVKSGYMGGICGCLEASNIQNTYSAGTVIASGGAASGGICGMGESSYIMQNVALNPAVNGKDAGCIIGEARFCEVSDNYFSEKLLLDGKHLGSTDTSKNLSALKKLDFYIRPISSGGLLGWETDTWTEADGGYPFPVLTGMKEMKSLKTPTYK